TSTAIEYVIAPRVAFDCPKIVLPQSPVRIAALEQLQLQSLLKQRGRNDKDNQQDERQVEQRRDVDFAQRHQVAALGEAAHGQESSLARKMSSSSFRYSVSILETSSWAKLSNSTVNTRRLCTSQL